MVTKKKLNFRDNEQMIIIIFIAIAIIAIFAYQTSIDGQFTTTLDVEPTPVEQVVEQPIEDILEPIDLEEDIVEEIPAPVEEEVIEPPAPVVQDNIISKWSLDGNALDSVGGNDGDVLGVTFVAGKFGQAASFDGENGRIDIGDPDSLETNSFTVDFWAKLNDPTDSFNGGIAKGSMFGTGSDFAWRIDFHKERVRAGIANPAGTYTGLTGDVTDDDWHRYTFTFSGTEVELFIDEVSVGTKVFSGTIGYGKSPDNILIGGRLDGDFAMDGLIDEVIIYDGVVAP